MLGSAAIAVPHFDSKVHPMPARPQPPIRRLSQCLAVIGSIFVLWSLQAASMAIAASDDVTHTASPARIISLNPSLTAIVVRLGALEVLVGVDEYSAELIEDVVGLPRVGGLFDPSLESVLALRPDRVLMVAGIDQQNHGQRLESLGIEVEVFENERLDQVLENIARLGLMLGRTKRADARIQSILGMRRAVVAAVEGQRRPSTLAVVDRSPLFLVGADTFIDEMLEIVGARNLAAVLGKGYPRGSIEWVIGAKPELLLDMTPGGEDSHVFWSRWPSLPAVKKRRVLTLDASRISMPGPDLDRALRELAIAVHGIEIDAVIEKEFAGRMAASSQRSGTAGR